MHSRTRGIQDRPVARTPIAVFDFETTGLNPGYDRVIEVSVIRIDPGRSPRLVLDTLVNPRRRVAATEIHSITDADVADAPEFGEIAGDVPPRLAHYSLIARRAETVLCPERLSPSI